MSRVLGIFVLLSIISSVWGADPKVVLRYTFPYTKVVNNYKTVTVEKDADCFLACVVDNKPADKKVQWIVQNYNTKVDIPISSDTDTQDAFKYQIDKPAANNWRLKIQNVQESDQALYICRVQLGGQQMANDSRMIRVIQKPQVVDIRTSSDTTKDEGDRLDLKCGASGIPTPVVTWRMVGGGILPTGGRELTAPTISVDNVNRNHKGMYQCIAENIAGRDTRNIYLDVKFEPTLSADNNEVFQAVGYSRELSCWAKGNPVPDDSQVYWSRDGLFLADPKKFQMENFLGSNYLLMKLTIHDINDGDYGQYRCYAENSKGNGESFVTLSRSEHEVRGTPELPGGASFLTVSITTVLMLVVTALLHCC